jgi:hypothetical protein
MKTTQTIQFTFSEEEINNVLSVYDMINSMSDTDYAELGRQIYKRSGSPMVENGNFLEGLSNLYHFMITR